MTHGIPCVLMRGGTSRGPFFLSDWLPAEPLLRDRTLLSALGSPHQLQIDGIGGGNALTSKVAIVSRSTRPGCDVDYLFAQVSVDEARVDTSPNCGNMLAGVGPFAIEQGLVPVASGAKTAQVRVYNVNTRSRIDLQVCIHAGRVQYEGDVRIDGVQGTSAPVLLNFLDAWGSATGNMFPTGTRLETIEGATVTCIDAAQLMVLIRAADLGLQGCETPANLDAAPALLQRIERIRRAAGLRMGLGEVAHRVLPKPVLVSPAATPGEIVSRYFTPWACHRAHAATGAVGVAVALLLPGTVAHDARWQPGAGAHDVGILHPAGRIDVRVTLGSNRAAPQLLQAALVRTARKILEGTLYVPKHALHR